MVYLKKAKRSVKKVRCLRRFERSTRKSEMFQKKQYKKDVEV